jgi:hypothetical protein
MIDYKYNEGKLLKELGEYIDKTYGEHYSQNKFQATEFIIDGGHGEGFCVGNILKYAQRYGKKDGRNRKDLLKVLHYAIIMLHVHDLNEEKENEIKRINPERSEELLDNQYRYSDQTGQYDPNNLETTKRIW